MLREKETSCGGVLSPVKKAFMAVVVLQNRFPVVSMTAEGESQM